MEDFSGLIRFTGVDEEDDEDIVCRKRLRCDDENDENGDDDDEGGGGEKRVCDEKEVSDMFVCSGDGCYNKLLHVVEAGVLLCPMRIDVSKYSRFVGGKLEKYDVRGVIERLNNALYVDVGTKFSEMCRYIMVDGILGDKNNAEFLADILLKIFCGVLIVDMSTVSMDDMVGELRMDVEKMRCVVTVLDEFMNPLENYKYLPAYNMIMGCWYGYVCMDGGVSDKFRMLCERLRNIAQSNSILYMDASGGNELYNHIKAISAWWVLRSTGFEKLMSLKSGIGEDLDILQIKSIEATEMICSLLCSRGVIIIGNGSSSGDIMYSIPLYVRDVFTYTYSKPYKFGELLRELNVLDTYSHVFAQYSVYLGRYFETANVEKSVPYVDNKYFTKNRFISWRNGIFCCITGVFYYNEDGLRRSRMPETWPYTLVNLKGMMGKNLILSMKYFDVDMLYDEYWIVMILSEYRRRMRRVNRKIDESAVMFDDGLDIVRDDGVGVWGLMSDDEKEHVRKELSVLDSNMHKPEYLKKLDPLDVRLRGAQKIVGDQRIPRGAYRILLEMFGRCFSGVIRSVYDSSNDVFSGTSFQYELLTRCAKEVEDRMDIGTVLSGAARTGKSTLGDMIKYYFNGHHVGVMGDKERNINSFSTIVGKQVVMNLDLTTDMDVDKLPLKAPYVKKGVVCEEIVQDELHSNVSKMIRFFIHFLFASNGQFPYPNVKMDMALRFAFFEFPFASNMGLGDTPMNMFQNYDMQVMLVVCVMAHLRRLLNMNSKIFYSPPLPENKEEEHVFRIPEYLLRTQMNYIRDKDSVHAFIMEGCHARKMIVNSDEREFSIYRDVFLELYKKYCKQHACEEKKESHVDEVLKKDFNVSMNEEIRTSYIGLKLL